MSSISQKVASLAFGDLVTRGLGFVSSMVLARALGPESYGIWTTALAIFSYLLWFSDLGIMQLGTREVATEGQRRLYSTTELFLGKLIWAICAMIILFLFAPFLPYSEETNTLVWLLLFSLIPYALHTEWIFSGKQEFLTLQSIKAAQATVFFALILYGIQRADDLEKLPVYYGLSVGLASFLLWTVSMYKRYLVISPSALTLDLIERIYSILKESLQLGIGWVGSQIILLFPPLIFALFYSDAFVGWYGAALRIIMLYMVLDRIFVQLLLPNLVNGWDKEISANSISTRLEQAYRYHTLLGLLGSFAVLFLAPIIIPLIYGDLYTESISMLQLLSPVLFLTFQNSVFATSLIAAQQSTYYLKANLLGGLFSAILIIAGSYVLLNNAPYAPLLIVLSEGIMMYLAYYYFNKYTLPMVKFCFYPMFLALAIGFLCYLWLMGNSVLLSFFNYPPNDFLSSLPHWFKIILTMVLAFIPLVLTKTIKGSDWNTILELMMHKPKT